MRTPPLADGGIITEPIIAEQDPLGAIIPLGAIPAQVAEEWLRSLNGHQIVVNVTIEVTPCE